MLIVNADDWGRSRAESDAAMDCLRNGRITSATAMVFMEDSERAAEAALSAGLDVGLHVNLSEQFTGRHASPPIIEAHNQVRAFLKGSKYAQLIYNPFLRKPLRLVYWAQWDEFRRLYGKGPTHVDGHQHMHLCANILLDGVIRKGAKIRRSFTFGQGEKGLLNRSYRGWVNWILARRYRLTDSFFCLDRCLRQGNLDGVFQRAKTSNVELMVHPIVADQNRYLMSDTFLKVKREVLMGSFQDL